MLANIGMTAPRLRTYAIVAALAAVPYGCSSGSPPANGLPSNVVAVQSLRTKLAALDGTYLWNNELRRHVFSNKEGIEALVASGSDHMIRELVDCIDDATESKVMLEGRPIPVGVLCHEALSQIVYYEPTAPDGDVAQRWPGHLEPTATADELRAAKRAWQDVVNAKSYIRL